MIPDSPTQDRVSVQAPEPDHPERLNAAIIGRGKTGSSVIQALDSAEINQIYHSQYPPTVSSLNQASVAIVFVNHQALAQLMPVLLEARLPVVCGTTGYDYGEQLHQQLIARHTPWVVASNFSVMMSVLRYCLQMLGQFRNLVPEAHYHIHETHHQHKQDAPSGTALRWRQWLGVPETPISSDRIGDEFGRHELNIHTDVEQVTLQHQARDRKLFARGAIWAAREIMLWKRKRSSLIAPGINQFSELVAATMTRNT